MKGKKPKNSRHPKTGCREQTSHRNTTDEN